MTSPLVAFDGDTALKERVLRQLTACHEAIYGGDGFAPDISGYALSPGFNASGDLVYEPRFGIPQALAELQELIFKGPTHQVSVQWPERFISAINPGANFLPVPWRFLHWLMTDPSVIPGILHPSVKSVVERCAVMMEQAAEGKTVDAKAAMRLRPGWFEPWAAREAGEGWRASKVAKSAVTAEYVASLAADAAAGRGHLLGIAGFAARGAAECLGWRALWPRSRAQYAVYEAMRCMADKLIELVAEVEAET